ncbi:MAG: glycosyltransferase family 2 protein [Pseudomonadota bacterium]
MPERVSVVIVSYNSADVLSDALSSVPAEAEVIVVDNDSEDGSTEIAAAFSANVIKNEHNLGFGTACNQGAEIATKPYILFLNPDARLTPNSLATLLTEISSDLAVAAVGPLLRGTHEIERPREATLLEPDRSPSFQTVPTEPTEVGFLSGAALLIRRDVFREIDGFDEKIFLYLEDDDLCYRLRQAGHRLRLIPAAVIEHETNTAVRSSGRALRSRNYHTMMSLRYLATKHRVEIDFDRIRRKTWRRLLISILTMDSERNHKSIGRLQGLDTWPFGRRQSD